MELHYLDKLEDYGLMASDEDDSVVDNLRWEAKILCLVMIRSG